jgi:hypothetical protein
VREAITNVLGINKKGLGEIEETGRNFRTASYLAEDRLSVGLRVRVHAYRHVDKLVVFGPTGA